MKSRFEKVSSVKEGAWGKTDLEELLPEGCELEDEWLRVVGIMPTRQS